MAKTVEKRASLQCQPRDKKTEKDPQNDEIKVNPEI